MVQSIEGSLLKLGLRTYQQKKYRINSTSLLICVYGHQEVKSRDKVVQILNTEYYVPVF